MNQEKSPTNQQGLKDNTKVKSNHNKRRRTQEEIIESLLAKPGLRSRIDANCVYCVYDELVPGTWREQVDLCTVTDCPLYEVRAKSKSNSRAMQALRTDPSLPLTEETFSRYRAVKRASSTLESISEGYQGGDL